MSSLRSSFWPRAAASPHGPHVITGDEVSDEVVSRVMDALPLGALDDVLLETLYAEEKRLVDAEDDERNAADRAFVARLRHDLARGEAEARASVRATVERYVAEISGHFDPRVYAVATRLLPRGIGGFLGGRAAGRLHFDLDAHVRLEGEVDTLRALARRGVVVLVPTHVSNVDSPLIGWAIYRLGLPPFAYAAGLNLFTSAALGFFMRNLGAYTVDRKKTDPLYRRTLKEYTTTLLARGQHGLWFPGGTRSRSGAVEKSLKLGLLGTVPEAYRRMRIARGPEARVFVVPCAVSYPLVLEASALVKDWLASEGRARFIDLSDELDRPSRWLAFLSGARRLDLRVHVRFGKPMDVVGNDVDDAGQSVAPGGRCVDPTGYFVREGEIVADAERDAEYTRMLGERVVRAYRRDTVAVATSAVAFAVFSRLRRARPHADVFRLLRILGPEVVVAEGDVLTDLQHLLEELTTMAARGAIHVAPELATGDARAVLDRALRAFGTYDAVPALERRDDGLHVNDAPLLFYYRNRLDGRSLLGERELS